MLKKIIKKFIWDLKGGYEPRKFWDNWADSFISDSWQIKIHPQHKWILSKIKELKPESILEIGCGFGRNINFLIKNGIEAEKIIGVDISSKMIDKAKEYLKKGTVRLIVADANNLPFKNKEFDLVLIHGVFMHVKPENIEKVITESLRVSKKDLIDLEQNYNGNEYTFVHNYKKIYKDNGAKIMNYINNKDLGLDYYHVEIR